MGSPGEPITYWQSLAVAADQGHLFLNPEAAQACSTACDDYLKKLYEHKVSAAELANADGWGDFESGRQLRTIFREKAVGGDNNLVDVLEGHIQVVREMQIVFRKFFTDTEARDQDNAADLSGLGPK